MLTFQTESGNDGAPEASVIDQRTEDANGETSAYLRPEAELATVLRSLRKPGVRITAGSGPGRRSGITIDLSVTSSRGTIGIVCDALDSARIRQHPALLRATAVDRVYCVSALTAMLDPHGVASALSVREPAFFRRSAGLSGRRTLALDCVTAGKPDHGSPAHMHRDEIVPTEGVRAA